MATPRIGELLVESGALTPAQLTNALAHQQRHGGRLGTNLVELGLADDRMVATVLARQLRIPSVTASQLERCDAAALCRLPAATAERLRAVPIREDAGKLWVAMADPADADALAELASATGRAVRAMVAPELLIQYALERHYRVARQPRVVQVPAGSSGLLAIDAPRTPTVPAGATLPPLPAPAAPAPLWDATGGLAPAVDVDVIAGYLDEQGTPTPSASRRATLQEVSAQLVAASSDEAIFDVVMRYVAGDVGRLAVLLLRRGLLGGWRGRGVDEAMLRELKVALEDVPAVARALSTGAAAVGRLSAADLGGLAAPLGAAVEALGVILPVRIGKRAVAAVVGLDASLEALRHKADYDRLAVKLDQALHISYLRRLLLSDAT